MNQTCLQDKNLVIIGGTSGIGLATASACLEHGARLVTVGLDESSVNHAQEILGERAIVMQSDATIPQTAQNAIDTLLRSFGPLHGLFHVAGGSGRRAGDGPLHEIQLEGWDYTLRLNLTSVFYSNQAAVRQFLQQETGGSVVNTSSVLAFSPSKLFSTHAYATAKTGVIGLTRSCAAYYASSDIRFNVLAPGLTDTPMSKRAMGTQVIQDYIKSKQPSDGGRAGKPSDLTSAVLFLLSDLSKYMTGQVIGVDGGWSVSEGHYFETE